MFTCQECSVGGSEDGPESSNMQCSTPRDNAWRNATRTKVLQNGCLVAVSVSNGYVVHFAPSGGQCHVSHRQSDAFTWSDRNQRGGGAVVLKLER